ncbi:hypothetical protein [Luteibacter yeojuensis]|uniref:Uncharacterized protein n=1 Tax=Luteibacter yeojuensis TaxID=345309 RepID=A0A7X5QS63_9GAMM|nr:hypothetical protein [Luteibacter yeojuensis]NID14379.1 hypothetical protein [Luteibacter yeojuensis]
MAFTREQLTARLEALDGALPRLRAEYPDDDEFWNAFASEADFAIECAGSDDYDWVNAQVDALLHKHGIEVRGDESPTDG